MTGVGMTGVGMTGVERIAEAFAAARADGRRAALMPYLMGGFPDLETSRRIGLAYADSGADLIELGVPFSDPLADGPVVHEAATAALRAGTTLEHVLGVARAIADRVPVVLMCYANPIMRRGPERFADALLDAQVSGLIVPDLPLEESSEILSVCDQRGLALVPLIAPTTTDQRLATIGRQARGFVYAVSLTGTTGERAALDGSGLSRLLECAGASTDVPVAVGFGISTPEHARQAVDAGADGVIIGSRLVRAARESDDPVAAVSELVRGFAAGLG
jgi:tryptophan synthase alpha chain